MAASTVRKIWVKLMRKYVGWGKAERAKRRENFSIMKGKCRDENRFPKRISKFSKTLRFLLAEY